MCLRSGHVLLALLLYPRPFAYKCTYSFTASEIVEGGGESSAETTTKTEREGRSVGWLARYRHQKKTSADAVRNHDEQNHHHSSPISAHPQHK